MRAARSSRGRHHLANPGLCLAGEGNCPLRSPRIAFPVGRRVIGQGVWRIEGAHAGEPAAARRDPPREDLPGAIAGGAGQPGRVMRAARSSRGRHHLANPGLCLAGEGNCPLRSPRIAFRHAGNRSAYRRIEDGYGTRGGPAAEAVISKNLRAFWEVGNALVEIKKSGLYRVYNSFEEYCRERWGMGRNYANKLIASTVLLENLGTIVPKPETEGQTRALSSLPAEEQRGSSGKRRWTRPRITSPPEDTSPKSSRKLITWEEAAEFRSRVAAAPRPRGRGGLPVFETRGTITQGSRERTPTAHCTRRFFSESLRERASLRRGELHRGLQDIEGCAGRAGEVPGDPSPSGPGRLGARRARSSIEPGPSSPGPGAAFASPAMGAALHDRSGSPFRQARG